MRIIYLFSLMILASFTAPEIMHVNASDYTLSIFGNANMDDVIDESDIAYVEGIIEGTNEETELADAKHDGVIDEDDIAQIELIIDRTESELTIVDSANRTLTIEKPVKTIIVVSGHAAEAIRILGSENKLAGVSNIIKKKYYYFSDLSDLPSVGDWKVGDYEAIAALDPDLVISYANWPPISEVEENLNNFGIPVIALEFTNPSIITEEIEKLGYLLDERDNAKKYSIWNERYKVMIDEFVCELSEDEKPRTFLETAYSGPGDISTYGTGTKADIGLSMVGGKNIADILQISYPHVDSEWVINEDPDVIIKYVMSSEVEWGWNSTETPESLVNSVINRDGWEYLKAVKDGRVYLISNEVMEGPDGIVGYLFWTKMLHPEFDADPVAAYREYLSDILVLECPDLIFSYPETDAA